jgi:division/cell wall cluster transcriptional repressor MraZ
MMNGNYILGCVIHSIDSKGRCIIPSKYRENFKGKIILIDVDDHIELWSYEDIILKLKKISIKKDNSLSVELIDYYKNLINYITQNIVGIVMMDRSGRILLNDKFKKKLKDNKVVFEGNLDHINIWSMEDFDQYKIDTTKKIKKKEER